MSNAQFSDEEKDSALDWLRAIRRDQAGRPAFSVYREVAVDLKCELTRLKEAGGELLERPNLLPMFGLAASDAIAIDTWMDAAQARIAVLEKEVRNREFYQVGLERMAESFARSLGVEQPDTIGPAHAMNLAKQRIAQLRAQGAGEVGDEHPGLEWRCITCERWYAEYVNGCPTCWANGGVRSAVRLVPERVNQHGLNHSEWETVVDSANRLHLALVELPEDEDEYDTASLLIVDAFVKPQQELRKLASRSLSPVGSEIREKAIREVDLELLSRMVAEEGNSDCADNCIVCLAIRSARAILALIPALLPEKGGQ